VRLLLEPPDQQFPRLYERNRVEEAERGVFRDVAKTGAFATKKALDT
jgi:hypothetical protein